MLKGTAAQKEAVAEGVRFVLGIFLISIILFLVLSPLEFSLQATEAQLVQGMLRAVGTHTRTTENPIQFFAGQNASAEKLIEISSLCSGLLEMILLAAAILVTRTATRRKKIWGIIFGIISLFVFNLVRMLISIQQLLHTSLEFAEFTHGVLFRIVLILGFALVYFLWVHASSIHSWAQRREWW